MKLSNVMVFSSIGNIQRLTAKHVEIKTFHACNLGKLCKYSRKIQFCIILINLGPCPSNWTYFSGTEKCYKMIEEELSWHDSRNHCKNLTKDRVCIHIVFILYSDNYLSSREIYLLYQTVLQNILLTN